MVVSYGHRAGVVVRCTWGCVVGGAMVGEDEGVKMLEPGDEMFEVGCFCTQRLRRSHVWETLMKPTDPREGAGGASSKVGGGADE